MSCRIGSTYICQEIIHSSRSSCNFTLHDVSDGTTVVNEHMRFARPIIRVKLPDACSRNNKSSVWQELAALETVFDQKAMSWRNINLTTA
jgi:hypothetical protein